MVIDFSSVSLLLEGLLLSKEIPRAYLVIQMVNILPAMQETGWILDWDDPLEKKMATYSSILAWRIPWAEEPGVL